MTGVEAGRRMIMLFGKGLSDDSTSLFVRLENPVTF